MIMTFIKLYNNIPNIGEYINFIFTDHKDNYLICKLVDYELDCIMTYKCLTSKKKIKSLKSLAPLNKEMIGIIENIDNNNIEINLININKNTEEYELFLKNNKKNNILKVLINQYSHKFNININKIIEKYLYNIKLENITYLDYILKTEIKNDFYNFIKKNTKNDINKKNKLKVNIKCYNDINNVIKLFDDTINMSNINDINIIQSKISEYLVTSNNNLDNFYLLLKKNIQNYNNQLILS